MGHELLTEHIEPTSGYSFDIWIPTQNLVVEFDGPFHYCNNTRTPLGSTVMKHRHIQQMGYILVVIPFWVWDMSDPLSSKQGVLQRHIDDALSTGRTSTP
mmetsp:Transcript_11772/g.22697  ORF Transcript_11772/g.22697 Transcript_11772/m.22697 type:complete len:100 (-) Transcript_11772:92-391(-)